MGDVGQITLTVTTAVSLLLFLPVLGSFVRMFPMLWASLFRTATCIHIEDSKKVQRQRDLVFCLMIPSLVTLVWKYSLYCPSWFGSLEEPFRLLSTAGTFAAFLLLRLMLGKTVPHRKFRTKTYEAALGSPKNFWIILTAIVFAGTFIFDICGMDKNLLKLVIFCLSGALYFIFIIRRYQIFAFDCNYLTAILYLCALEILPTALFVIPAAII